MTDPELFTPEPNENLPEGAVGAVVLVFEVIRPFT